MLHVVLAQQPVEQGGELVEAVHPLADGQLLAEDARVEVAARAETADEAAARDVVEREQVAQEGHGVAVVR